MDPMLPPDAPPAEAAARAFLLLMPVFGQVSDEAARDAGALTPQRVGILWTLTMSPMRGTDVAKALGISRPAVTQATKQLVAQGLVAQVADEQDARVRRLVLTEKGMAELVRFDQAVTGAVAQRMARLPEETQRRLAADLEALRALVTGAP